MAEEIVAGRNAVFEALSSKRPVNKIFIKAGLQGGSLGKIIAAVMLKNLFIIVIFYYALTDLTNFLTLPKS